MGTMGRAQEPIKFLESLAKQSTPAHELIIIDQNEDERLAPVDAKAKELNIPALRIKEAIKNLAHARNVGIVKASGDIIGFPDDDCWYEPGVIQQVEECFHLNPDIDAISGLWLEAPAQNLSKGTMPSKELLDFKGARLNSITLFVRRSALNELHGFDPRLGTGQWFGAGEETDLTFRLAIKGKRFYYEPKIKVHHPHFDPAQQSYSRIRSYSRGTGALYAKLQLPTKTILRGLVAPIIKSTLPPYSAVNKLKGLYQSIGRIEGWLAWHRNYGSGENSWNNHDDVKLFDK
jgi:glycosyltransferase involved in cell wall biosynthesis